MTTTKKYPPVYCDKHAEKVFLVDVIESTGALSRQCPRCVEVVLIDVVKQIFRRDVKKASGQ